MWSIFFLPNVFHVGTSQKNEGTSFLPNTVFHKSQIFMPVFAPDVKQGLENRSRHMRLFTVPLVTGAGVQGWTPAAPLSIPPRLELGVGCAGWELCCCGYAARVISHAWLFLRSLAGPSATAAWECAEQGRAEVGTAKFSLHVRLACLLELKPSYLFGSKRIRL